MEVTGRLRAKKIGINGMEITDYGIVSTRLITTAFREYIVDAFQPGGQPLNAFRYHDSGVGTTAATVLDTALEDKVEVGREIGTQEEGDETTIFKSVATITYTALRYITEHGFFSTLSGPTMADRSVFAGIIVTTGEKIEFTFEWDSSPSGIEVDLTEIMFKVEKLNQYLRCLMLSLFGHGLHITAQDMNTFLRQQSLLSERLNLLEEDEISLAAMSKNFYVEKYQRIDKKEKL